ncbi:MAG: tetratricopeptide repeat protein [Acidobacteriota bacterium]
MRRQLGWACLWAGILGAVLLFLSVQPLAFSVLQDFDAQAGRAAEARLAGRLPEAAELYRQLVERRPDWQEGRWFLGTILYDQGKYDEALQVFQDMVARWPYHGPAVGLIGLCQFQRKEYERALLNFQKGHVLGFGQNPALISTIRYHAAIVLNRLGRYEAAYTTLKAFPLENTRSRKILLAFGLSVLQMPYLPEETPVDKEAVVMAAGTAAYEAEHGNRQQAEEMYRRLIADFPTEPNVHYAYGRFLLALDPGPALEQFEKELEISPGNVSVLVQIALEYIQEGRFAEARPYAERVVAASPRLYRGHNALGQVLLETGDTEGSIRELERSIELEPLSPESHFLLARAYLKIGRKDDAQRERAEFKRLYDLKAQADKEILGPRPAPSPPER